MHGGGDDDRCLLVLAPDTQLPGPLGQRLSLLRRSLHTHSHTHRLLKKKKKEKSNGFFACEWKERISLNTLRNLSPRNKYLRQGCSSPSPPQDASQSGCLVAFARFSWRRSSAGFYTAQPSSLLPRFSLLFFHFLVSLFPASVCVCIGAGTVRSLPSTWLCIDHK